MKLLSHPILLEHGLESHPESPKRLQAVLEAIENSPYHNLLDLSILRRATIDELELVHTKDYIDRVLSGGHLDPEMEITAETVEAALVAVGLGLELVEQKRDGFLLVRPPGHHAEPSMGMGYCLFNNIAIAAKKAIQIGCERICVIDFDVHFANGTQKALEGDSRILLMDIHQENLYPQGFGAASIVLPAESGDREYLELFEAVIKPKVRTFCPELVLVSAGFDAHESDPHGNMHLTTEGFGKLAKGLSELAPQLILFLEGGYNDYFLARNVLETVRQLCLLRL